MESKAVKNIHRILRQIKLYQLDQNGLTDAELAAYDVGFYILEQRLAQLLAGLSIATAGPELLDRYEECYGIFPQQGRELAARRRMLSCIQKVNPGTFQWGALNAALSMVGIAGSISEQRTAETLTVQIKELSDSALSLEQIYVYLERMLPTHLDWSLNYGKLTFAMLDSGDFTWDSWDAKNFPWNDFDQQGETLFP